MTAYENVLRHPRSRQARRDLVVEWKHLQDPRLHVLELEVTGRDMIAQGLGDGMKLEDAHRILYKHGKTRELAGPIFDLTTDFEFNYGLVTFAAINASEFNSKASALFGSAPLLSLTLIDPADDLSVVNNPALSQILDLSFGGRGIDDDLAIALSRSEYVGDVRILTLGPGTIVDHGLSALHKTKKLPNLISLEVTGNPCQPNLMEVAGGFYVVGEAGKTFLDAAERTRLNADAYEIMWPPSLNAYAWID